MSISEKILRAKADYDEVYAAGYAKGKAEGGGGSDDGSYDQGYADGKQAEYDAFWDAYQKNGGRVGYGNAFIGEFWNSQNFRPKYDIVPSSHGSSSMFENCGYVGDLVALCEQQGITVDFSNCVEWSRVFYGTKFTRIGTIDARKATRFYYVFCYSRSLVTIDKIICAETTPFLQAFLGLNALEEIRFEGTIGSSIDLKESPKLSKDSINSIMYALSTTTSGLTLTLSKTAVNAAFETSTGAVDGSTSTEWTTLIGTRSNWTISLV